MAKSNIIAVSKRLRKRFAKMPEKVSEVKEEVARTVFNHLVNNTPVDTSRALSNWQVGIGDDRLDYIPPHIPGEAGSSQAASVARGIQLLKAALTAVQPGQTIFVSNNAPYIQLLEDGYSPQGRGFVREAVRLGRLRADQVGGVI